MRIPVVVTACFIGVMASLPAVAGPAQTAQNSQQSDDNKIVCKVVYHEGMAYRSASNCATKEQWNRERIRTQEAFRNFQQRSLAGRPYR